MLCRSRRRTEAVAYLFLYNYANEIGRTLPGRGTHMAVMTAPATEA